MYMGKTSVWRPLMCCVRIVLGIHRHEQHWLNWHYLTHKEKRVIKVNHLYLLATGNRICISICMSVDGCAWGCDFFVLHFRFVNSDNNF